MKVSNGHVYRQAKIFYFWFITLNYSLEFSLLTYKHPLVKSAFTVRCCINVIITSCTPILTRNGLFQVHTEYWIQFTTRMLTFSRIADLFLFAMVDLTVWVVRNRLETSNPSLTAKLTTNVSTFLQTRSKSWAICAKFVIRDGLEIMSTITSLYSKINPSEKSSERPSCRYGLVSSTIVGKSTL